MTTHLVIPDCHAHPDHNNDRADLLSNLIYDLRPEKVVNMGDTWDFPSLSSYDRGTKSFVGRNYQADLESGQEFNDRIFSKIRKAKKKQPKKYFLEGNHEHRQEKAIQTQPELEGAPYGLSFSNLQLEKHYDEIIRYEGGTPGILSLDGIAYAHYFVSGSMGRPIGGLHHANSLVSKNLVSSTAAHSHTVDWDVRNSTSGKTLMGLVAGVFQDYDSDWAGVSNNQWWRGVVVCRNVEDGVYDPQFISMKRLKEEYA